VIALIFAGCLSVINLQSPLEQQRSSSDKSARSERAASGSVDQGVLFSPAADEVRKGLVLILLATAFALGLRAIALSDVAIPIPAASLWDRVKSVRPRKLVVAALKVVARWAKILAGPKKADAGASEKTTRKLYEETKESRLRRVVFWNTINAIVVLAFMVIWKMHNLDRDNQDWLVYSWVAAVLTRILVELFCLDGEDSIVLVLIFIAGFIIIFFVLIWKAIFVW